MVQIGRRNILSVVREMPQGLYLDGGRLGDILLPRRYVPEQVGAHGVVDVFVYLDSEDRLVATTEQPIAMVGEFACLSVVALNKTAGAFLDWGLSKDLLLPFREQEDPVRVGNKVIVAIDLDERSNRIIASARLRRYLSQEHPPYRTGQKVSLLITRPTPLGYEAIVENHYLGLLFGNNILTPLAIGQKIEGFVKSVRPDGKIDLSLDALGYQRVGSLQLQVIQALQKNAGTLKLGDKSSPEEIRAAFGVSKKAFKQAVGALYKQRQITITDQGIQLLEASPKPAIEKLGKLSPVSPPAPRLTPVRSRKMPQKPIR